MPPPVPAAPKAGRHRRVPPPGRSALLALLAVLMVLLGGGTALVKLTAAPAGEVEAGLAAASPGPSPTATASPGSPSPSPSPRTSPTAAPPSPAASPPAPSPAAEAPPEPDPVPERESERESRRRPPAEPVVDEITALEDEVTALTNAERTAAGCGEVGTDERLRTAARGHSADMAANDYFSHTSLDGRSFVDRARAAGYSSPAGENIAMGYRTPADVVRGWMNSDGHRRNILTCSHQAIGVGLAYDANGRPYWTQVFGR